jgi:predicted CoA-binding protein
MSEKGATNVDQAIQDFINGKRIAIVGVSRDGDKFGNTAFAELAARGYQVIAVHPTAQEIAGTPCYPNLAALRGQVDGVLVVVSPQQAMSVLREAATAGLKNVWLQQGAESPEALALARDLKLNLVAKKCVLMYAPPVRSFHTWHRVFAKLLGQF